MTTSQECEALNRKFIIDSTVTPFRNSRPILSTHNNLLRFGRTSDINQLISGPKSASDDYLVGLVLTSICIFAFFVAWMIGLLVFWCLGHKQVGFLSGRRVQRPKPPERLEVAKESTDQILSAEMGGLTDFTADIKIQENKLSNQEDDDEGSAEYVFDGDNNDDSGLKEEKGDLAQEYSAQLEQWKADVKSSERRLRRIRIGVLISGLIIVVSAILMTSLGVDSLHVSSDKVRQTVDAAKALSLEAVKLIDDFAFRQERAIEQTSEFARKVNTFCPKVRAKICSNLTSLQNCSFDGLPDDLIESVNDTLAIGRTFVFSQVEFLREDLLDFAGQMEDYHQLVDSFSWTFWVAAAFALTLAALTILLLFGVFFSLGENENLSCFHRHLVRNWLVVPIYSFFVIMSWVFSMAFVIGAGLTADFCVNSPDSRVLLFMRQNEDLFSSLLFKFGTFYISGCSVDLFPFDIEKGGGRVLNLLSTVSELGRQLTRGGETIRDTCGGDPTALQALGLALEKHSCALATTILDVRDFFQCVNFRPVYEKAVHKAICYEGTQGFSWIALTQIFVVFFSMIMLTLRAGFAEIEDEEDQKAPKRLNDSAKEIEDSSEIEKERREAPPYTE